MTSLIGDIKDNQYIVTGACGRIGRRVVEALCCKQASVVAYCLDPEILSAVAEQNPESLRVVSGSYEEAEKDLGKIVGSGNNIKERIVIHLAGMVSVPACDENPGQAFDSNVFLTHKVLDFCKANNIKRFIFVSSGNVYGDRLDRPACENDPVYALGVYSATKLAAENLVEGYCHSFGMKAFIVRLSNVYMKDPSPDAVLGAIIGSVEEGGDVCVKKLYPVRDFIYVDDVVEGLVRLSAAQPDDKCVYVNLSSGRGSSVEELAGICCGKAGISRRIIGKEQKLDDSYSYNVLNNEKLRKILDWVPGITLEQGIEKVME
ncbi:NAD-dependent epimerase/dehydratase family protein [Verrucomicrobiota bacterium]